MARGINSCTFCEVAEKKPKVHFLCPEDGFVHQEMVSFLCNKCDAREMIYKDGMYICPQCLTEPDGFECRLCGSTEVDFFEGQAKS